MDVLLPFVAVTTAQTVRTTTRALVAHVNRTCVQTEREIEEEEMFLWRIGVMRFILGENGTFSEPEQLFIFRIIYYE